MSTPQDQITRAVTAEELNALHAEIEDGKRSLKDTAGSIVQKVIALGQALEAKKTEVGHGHFIAWIKNNLKFSRTLASLYMRVSRNVQRVEHLSDATSLRQALELCDAAESGVNKQTEHELIDSANSTELCDEVGAEGDEQQQQGYEDNPFVQSKLTFVSKLTKSFFKKTRLLRADEWKEEEKKDLYFLLDELQKLIAELESGGTEKPANASVI